MPELAKNWVIAQRVEPGVDFELREFPPIIRQILCNRNCKTAEAARAFLDARPPDGSDPFNLLGMHEATNRLCTAILNKEAVAVYGDYDVDGVTATALLVQVLQELGANAQGYIPNRFDEGYGVNKEALSSLCEKGVRVVVTVDCGIRSPQEACYARELGLDLIITDHHHPSGELPKAYTIVNPKQPGDEYPYKELAGVGLAYKLAAALVETLQRKGDPISQQIWMDDYLDLVALGTVADLAPLKGENRALVRLGLEQLRTRPRQGVWALMQVAGINPAHISAGDIGFALGPRLNAAGRLDSAMAALDLLTTRDVTRAGELAQKLENQNRDRQQITRDIQAQAEQIALAGGPPPLLLFAAHPDFNSGIIGLAASRLTEKYYRPSIVAYQGEEFTRASCRSIKEFHITDALDMCQDLLEHHGGHAAAAGFTVRTERLPELIARLNGIAADQLSDQTLQQELVADIEIPLKDLHPDLLPYLNQLQPTGYDNPQAYFVTKGVLVRNVRAIGRDSAHLKFAVSDNRLVFDAIAFRQGHWAENMPAKIDIIYSFELNEYNGRTSLQLNVRDLKPSEA